ncbi:MAG: ATP-dependent exoDNAse [Mycobacterium sp.]|nr:ATP-dependent exoDNAse [Mycobacterium sp.]
MRHRNEIYFSTAEADPHRVLTPKATHPQTAVDVLTAILARDGAQTSATTEARRAADAVGRLARCADMYLDAVGSAAEHHLGPDTMTHSNHCRTDGVRGARPVQHWRRGEHRQLGHGLVAPVPRQPPWRRPGADRRSPSAASAGGGQRVRLLHRQSAGVLRPTGHPVPHSADCPSYSGVRGTISLTVFPAVSISRSRPPGIGRRR